VKVAAAVPGWHSDLTLILLDFRVYEEEVSENCYEEQDAQAPTNTKRYYILVSHCSNSVVCGGLSTG